MLFASIKEKIKAIDSTLLSLEQIYCILSHVSVIFYQNVNVNDMRLRGASFHYSPTRL